MSDTPAPPATEFVYALEMKEPDSTWKCREVHNHLHTITCSIEMEPPSKPYRIAIFKRYNETEEKQPNVGVRRI